MYMVSTTMYFFPGGEILRSYDLVHWEILNYIYKHNVRLITAPEDKILEARAEIAAKGIYCEHTTAASYAAYKKYCEMFGRTEDTLISMCGAGLKSDH